MGCKELAMTEGLTHFTDTHTQVVYNHNILLISYLIYIRDGSTSGHKVVSLFLMTEQYFKNRLLL